VKAETTARTRRPRGRWLRKRWRLVAALGGAAVLGIVVVLILVSALDGGRSEALDKLERQAQRRLKAGTFVSLKRADEALRKLLRKSAERGSARSKRLLVVATLAVEYGHGIQRAAERVDEKRGEDDAHRAAGRALAALAAKEPERARVLAKQAGVRFGGSAWVAYARATVARWVGAADDAVTLLAGVKPGAARSFVARSRARALLELGRVDEASRALEALKPARSTRSTGSTQASRAQPSRDPTGGRPPWAVLLGLRIRLARAESSLPEAALDGALGLVGEARAVTSATQQRWAHLLLAEGYGRLGKPKKRRTHLGLALEGEPPFDPALAEALGDHLLRHGRPKAASRLARQVVERFGRRRSAIALQARAAMARDQPKAALEALRRIPASRRPAAVRLVEARAQRALGRKEKARSLLRRLRREHPGRLPVRLAWARQLIADDRGDDALVELEAILREAPRHVDVIREVARLELRKGKAADAVTRFEAAMRLRPESPSLRAELIRAYLAAGDRKAAKNAAEAAISAFPKHPAVLAARGRLRLTAGDLEAAEKAFRQALEAKKSAVEATLGLAEVLLTRGKLAEAARWVAKAESRAPRRARWLRGWLALERWDEDQGDPDTARQALRRAARAGGPEARQAGRLLIETYARQRERRGAERVYRELSQRFGDDPELRAGLALALLDDDEYLAAGRLLGRALRDNQTPRRPPPLRARLYARLAQAFWQAGTFSTASRRARQALQIWPHCARAKAILGIVDYERRRPRRARRRLREAVAADPQLALAHYYLGMANLQLGARSAGREHLRRYLAQRPGGMLAVDARRALRR
jgi:tetratricopeptide (TPR) repeat protein